MRALDTILLLKDSEYYVSFFRSGFQLLGFSYTPMKNVYMLKSFHAKNNFSVINRKRLFKSIYIYIYIVLNYKSIIILYTLLRKLY